MPLIDFVASLVSRPAGRVVQEPVKEIVYQAIREHDLVSTTDLDMLKRSLSAAESKLKTLEKHVSDLEGQTHELRSALGKAQSSLKASDAVRKQLRQEMGLLEKRLQQLQTSGPHASSLPSHVPSRSLGPDVAEKRQMELLDATGDATPSAPVVKKPEKPKSRKKIKQCRIPGCTSPYRSKGFCSAHYQQWRRGSLKGYVSNKGIITDGNLKYRVDVDMFAGQKYRLKGPADDRQVFVDGRLVNYEITTE